MKQNEVLRRYTRRFGLSMIAYVLVVVAANSMLQHTEQDSILRIPLAVAPVVPLIFVLNSILQALLESDELQQRIQLSAIAFAAGATGLLTFSYSFLEGIGFPHLPVVWVLPGMILLWGLGMAFYSRRYR
jgi:hypothetical protein